ncbi:hypothetical protein LG047_01670 [Methylocystis sp. WRRC1]|uniref:hypothetical protein n=1 Tax=Methylocystis sp. WRRC1 TaxID=1732014 RepID=UPI001D15033E|nr:hypothetical protein [Methylocystis sp. WRRC1]MCC3244037.1 hypothetical protein [Methylocystis sp. WRRC1]
MMAELTFQSNACPTGSVGGLPRLPRGPHILRMARKLILVSLSFLTVALLVLTTINFSPALDGWRMIRSADDPAALTDAQLDKSLTPARFSEELDAALASRDEDLAASFIDLGSERGLAPSPAQKARLEELRAGAGDKALEEFAEGFVHGDRDSGAAFAGALAGDLTGYGDARDLWNEAAKLARGEKADELVIGLAATGLVLSAAAWSSIGAVLPARGGLTLVKTAQKTGRLTRPLALALTRTAARAIDREALTAGLAAAAKLDLAASRAAAARVVRPGALATFRALGEDAAVLYRQAGARGAKQVLALAEDGAQVRKAARLAAVKGGKTRAILATLGRSALGLGALAVTAANAIFASLAGLLGLAMLAQRLGFWLGRRLRFS